MHTAGLNMILIGSRKFSLKLRETQQEMKSNKRLSASVEIKNLIDALCLIMLVTIAIHLVLVTVSIGLLSWTKLQVHYNRLCMHMPLTPC